MHPEYPNLPLIEYIFNQVFRNAHVGVRPDIKATVFLQTFPNTARIFEDGRGFSGQAFCDEYITVMWCENTKIYAVFGGNKLAYYVEKPNQKFFDDLKNHDMKTVSHQSLYNQPESQIGSDSFAKTKQKE